MTETLNCIYLIDDDRSINLYNRWVLEGMNIAREICEFPSAEKALEAAQTICKTDGELPQLVLVDVNMPEMDGLEFARQFNKLDPDRSKSLLAFLLTSPLLPEQEADIGSLGFRHFLEKPLEASDVESILPLIPQL